MKFKFSKLLSGVFIISAVLILNGCCKKKCSICQDNNSQYDTLFLGQPDTCDLIILKKKKQILPDSSNGFVLWSNSIDEVKTEPIHPDTAIKYIRIYNETYNHDLAQTTFVDFNISKLIDYMTNTIKYGRADTLRIYLAKNEEEQNKIILVGKNSSGDFYNNSYQPLDYGGLCPPPDKSCVTAKQAKLLLAAIQYSQTHKPAPGSGRTVIDLP